MTEDKRIDLAAEIVAFCSTERSYWELLNRFDILENPWRQVLREAVACGRLTKRQGADCFYFRAAFPGVDIDRVHFTRQGRPVEAQP